MKKNFCLFFYITFILISLLKCETYNETELKNMCDENLQTYSFLSQEDLMSESDKTSIANLIQSIENQSNHEIFLIMIGTYSGNLDSTSEKFANSYCFAKEECVFIICENDNAKIGSYFGTKTGLKSSDANTNFTKYQNTNKNVVTSMKQLLNTIKNNIKIV